MELQGHFDSVTRGNDSLERYLRAGHDAIRGLTSLAERDGVVIDFSVESVSAFFKWILPQLRVLPEPADTEASTSNQDSDALERDLFQFDARSRLLIKHASFYLGACFVDEYDDILSWSIGDAESAERDVPVVAGFLCDIRMSPSCVAKKAFMRAIGYGEPGTVFEDMVAAWTRLAVSDEQKTVLPSRSRPAR